jgi:putative transposase
MARPLRVEFVDAVYHVMARGNERRRIFYADEDRLLFLKTLDEAAARFAFGVHAWVLMPNHYHVVIQTHRPNLSQAWGWLQATFTIRFNRAYRRSGHLFQGRFKAQVVDADEYAAWLVEYLHLNPIRGRERGKPVIRGTWQQLESYSWSSHGAYCGKASLLNAQRVEWLRYWDHRSRKAGQKAYQNALKELVNQAGEPRGWKALGEGWLLADSKLEEKVNRLLGRKTGQEEERWKIQKVQKALQAKMASILEDEPDWRWKIWLRLRVGGERAVDVGRELGYKSSGAGILEVIKRLEKRTEASKREAAKMKKYSALRIES